MSSGSAPGVPRTRATTVTPWYSGVVISTAVVRTLRASRYSDTSRTRSSGSARSSSCSRSGGMSTRGTTSTRTGPPGAAGGRHRARATDGAASSVSRSKSWTVTARCPVRSDSGPRIFAFSTVSASTPPRAESRFSTRPTNGMEVLSTVSVPAPTLPRVPPPVR